MREVAVHVPDEGPWGSPIFWGLRPPPKPGAEEMGVRDVGPEIAKRGEGREGRRTQTKGLLTQFCSRSIAIQRLVSCEENGDQWGGPKFSQLWALGTLRRKKGLSLSTGRGTRRNEFRKQQERGRVDSWKDFLA